ncbi:MAG: hypothetical protein Q7R45_07990 [Sulfuricaulis sp.]|nr:hypothetical protein [Sulfuricaulis sp.]
MGWQDGTPVESGQPAWMGGKPVAPKKSGPEPGLKEHFLSLIAPGGMSRITAQAQKDYDKAAYNLGGAVSDQASKILPPGGAAALGTAANVGMQALPMLAGSEFGAMAKPAFQGAGRSLMKSAIKPSVADLHGGRVPKAIETMLEGGYSPTNAGVGAMRAKAAGLSDDVANLIAPSNKLVDVAPAAQSVAGVANKATAGTMGMQDAKQASDVARSMYAHPAVDNAGTMSVQAAQAMKQANYKALGDASYGMGLKPAAERDAIKALTAQLKKGIERAEPGVAPINKEISELLNAVKVSQRRALIEGNKDVIPLGASVATALANPAAALGLYANSSAAVKSLLARMLYSGAEAIPQTVGGAIGGAIGAESGTAPTQAEMARILRSQQ